MGEKPKKEKKAKKEAEDAAPAVERKVVLAPIAKPLADEKLEKKASFEQNDRCFICSILKITH